MSARYKVRISRAFGFFLSGSSLAAGEADYANVDDIALAELLRTTSSRADESQHFAVNQRQLGTLVDYADACQGANFDDMSFRNPDIEHRAEALGAYNTAGAFLRRWASEVGGVGGEAFSRPR